MRPLCLTNFPAWHCHWQDYTLSLYNMGLKENYKTPSNLFKGLKPNPKAAQTFFADAPSSHNQSHLQPPNIIEMALDSLLKWGGDLIMITPFWPDQSWFQEIICLAIEPPRRFRPSQWLLWNARTQEMIPKVMKSIQLTVWRLTLPSMPREE